MSLAIAPESALISQSKRLLADAYVGQDKYRPAEKTAHEALAVAEKIGERAEIAACCRVLAQVEQHKNNKDKAKEWYKKAVDIFSQISSRYELAVTRYQAAMSGFYSEGERSAMLFMAAEYFESEEIRHYTAKVKPALGQASKALFRAPPKGAKAPVFIAVHPLSKKLISTAGHVARSSMTVFLTGPTGSGKDQLARYIHYISGRQGEFVTVNCAAIPDSMVESELFGHRKGAFTGAGQDRKGLFMQADGGTLYLNEIADTRPELQAKLLEVIETKTVRRLGENKVNSADVRIIAATNHDLEQLMDKNRFRADLYHRLNEIPITLPPLDARKDDIPALVKHFFEAEGHELGGAEASLVEQLGRILSMQSWPGNVRQLRSEVNRLRLAAARDIHKAIALAFKRDCQSDREQLVAALRFTQWNRRMAARLLGVSEGTIRARIKKFGISRGRD